jgi:hypothetical protein
MRYFTKALSKWNLSGRMARRTGRLGIEHLEPRCLMAYLAALNPQVLSMGTVNYAGDATNPWGIAVGSGETIYPRAPALVSDTEGTTAGPLELRVQPGPDDPSNALCEVTLTTRLSARAVGGGGNTAVSVTAACTVNGNNVPLVFYANSGRVFQVDGANNAIVTELVVPIDRSFSLSIAAFTSSMVDTTRTPLESQVGWATVSIESAVQVIGTAGPTLVTTASPAAITLDSGVASALTDTAVLSGGNSETGSITFRLTAPDGVTVLDTETVAVDGDGNYTTPNGYTLPATGDIAGTYTWTASYSGDPNNLPANDQGGRDEQTVVSQADTTTTLTSSTDPIGSHYGESVTFTAKVDDMPPADRTPTGEVDFFDNGEFLGSCMLSGGVATFTTDALAVGDHPITAQYAGDDNFSSSTSDIYIQSVAKVNTDLIGPFGDASVYGQPL